MKKILKYVFETEKDHKILQAVKKYVGKSSLSGREEDGLTNEEAILCSEFFDLITEEDLK